MSTVEAAVAVATEQSAEIAARSEGLTAQQWELPTVPTWTVRDLLDHVSLVMHLHAEAFERSASGSLEQPPWPQLRQISADQVASELHTGARRLAMAVATADPAGERPVPLPFGVLPTSMAVAFPATENALHRWDLEQALGNAGYTLPAGATEVALPVFGPVMSMIGGAAGRPPDMPLSIAFDNPQLVFGLCHDGVAWALTTGEGADCRIAGTASDIVLLASGRRAVGEGSLSASGPQADAGAALRSYFPMP